jgi:putative peptidoglycan lipid II flippase
LSSNRPREVRAAPGRGLGLSTAIFGVFTALSRVIGLIRESVAAALFGQGAAASAFTFASQIPNLLANLFAQAALSAAFVPVFTDLLEQGRKEDARRLASSLLWILVLFLGALTVLGILLAAVIPSLFSGRSPEAHLAGLLTQIMFPVVLALGATGLLVGVLQSYDRFSLGAFVPVVWNGVIILLTLLLKNQFKHQVEAYAVGWLVATFVQLLLVIWAVWRLNFGFSFHIDWHNPLVRQVFALMLPVTVGLGIANLDALINSAFGALVNTGGPRAIQNAFLIYMLPQGIFSVAITTVLFPTLSRQAARRDPRGMRDGLASGIRQINLLLLPSAVGIMVLAVPIIQVLFQRDRYTHADTLECALALRWFAVSLPFSGINLLLTRTFFALKLPWLPARYAAVNMVVDIILSVALYKPFGVAGLVIGTAAANMVMTYLQLRRLHIGFNRRLDLGHTLMITVRLLVAAVLCGAIARLAWVLISDVLGHAFAGQIFAVAIAVVLAGAFYAWAVTKMRIPEARQVQTMIRRRIVR